MDQHVWDVLESVYHVDQAVEPWLRGVANALVPLLDRGSGVGALSVDCSRAGEVEIANPVSVGMNESEWQRLYSNYLSFPPAARLAIVRAMGPVSNGSDIDQAMRRATPAFALYQDAQWRRQYGEDREETFARGASPDDGRPIENRAVLAMDAAGSGCAFIAPSRRSYRIPSLEEVTLWTRLTSHMASGFRLRKALAQALAPTPPEAVLTPSGRVEDAVGPARDRLAREALRQAAIDVERVKHGRGRMRAVEATERWRALVSGRWSLVDRFDHDGRRYYIAHANPPAVAARAPLTEREEQIARYAALGHPNKMIAYELGLATSTVATVLQRVARKLGVRSRVELIQRILSGDGAA
jgi:DNA-binding CsgD family transcriptional regulator